MPPTAIYKKNRVAAFAVDGNLRKKPGDGIPTAPDKLVYLCTRVSRTVLSYVWRSRRLIYVHLHNKYKPIMAPTCRRHSRPRVAPSCSEAKFPSPTLCTRLWSRRYDLCGEDMVKGYFALRQHGTTRCLRESSSGAELFPKRNITSNFLSNKK